MATLVMTHSCLLHTVSLVKVSEAEPGRREGEKGGGKKEGEVEEEEQGFKLAPSEYLNTIRQVDKDFRGNASDLILLGSSSRGYHHSGFQK
jgi:hypothetical protein